MRVPWTARRPNQSILKEIDPEYSLEGTLSDATDQQIYHAVASTVRDQIMQKWVAYREKDKHSDGKRLYYLSVEFLTGRSLHCNILNLCSQDNYQQAFEELGLDWRRIFKEEPEPGLGNGGLGRLVRILKRN